MPRTAKPADTDAPEPGAFVFECHIPLTYTEARDAAGGIVGLVQPGDVRTLAEPIDGHWRPATKREADAARAVPPSSPNDPGSDPDGDPDGTGEGNDGSGGDDTGSGSQDGD